MTNWERFRELIRDNFGGELPEKPDEGVYCSGSPCGMYNVKKCQEFDCEKCRAWRDEEWKPRTTEKPAEVEKTRGDVQQNVTAIGALKAIERIVDNPVEWIDAEPDNVIWQVLAIGQVHGVVLAANEIMKRGVQNMLDRKDFERLKELKKMREEND